MTTTHTPGPWRADGLSVYHRGGGDTPRKPLCLMDTEYLYDCAPDPARATDSEICMQEAQANARLIAAAPELLEACRELFDPSIPDSAARAHVWAAIAKAQGGAK